MAGYVPQPAIFGLPLGGRVPQGGAHTLPPSTRPAQSFAGCFCASCSLLLRPVCASLAWLLVAARIRGHHAARWAARGLPRSPRPLRSRALGRFAPRRALSPPAPWARKRAPLLLRAALVGCFIRGHRWLGPLSLPSALWASARSFVPPWFFGCAFEKIISRR